MNPVTIAINKRLRLNYATLEDITAGIVLFGAEIKSIRKYKIDINNAFVTVSNKNEFFLNNALINDNFANIPFASYNSKRKRKLLVTKFEIRRWSRKIKAKNLAIIPTKVFLNQRNILKIKICLCSGIKRHDRRELLKAKAIAKDNAHLNREWRIKG